jgi:hypothetical protein
MRKGGDLGYDDALTHARRDPRPFPHFLPNAKRDLANAQVPAPERLQSPLDLVELEQAVAAAASAP